MKKLTYILAIFAVVLSSCKPSQQEAADFNDKIMSEQKKVVTKYDELLETYDTYVAKKMDDALLEFESQIQASIFEVKNIPDIVGGEELKEAVLDYFEVYQSVAKDEAPELVRLYKVPENEFSGEMRVQWDSKYKEVDTKLKEADKKLQAVQNSFAENFHLKLTQPSAK
jgi:hypothetical protein